jgi:hypothetical protein
MTKYIIYILKNEYDEWLNVIQKTNDDNNLNTKPKGLHPFSPTYKTK